MKCIHNYDPAYGFKMIKKDEEVLIKVFGDYYLAHIENESGHLLGTIFVSEIKNHFA